MKKAVCRTALIDRRILSVNQIHRSRLDTAHAQPPQSANRDWPAELSAASRKWPPTVRALGRASVRRFVFSKNIANLTRMKLNFPSPIYYS